MSAPSVRASMGLGTPCPKCGCTGSTVEDTMKAQGGIYRRRRCTGCGERYSTAEVVLAEDVGFVHDYSKARPKPVPPATMSREQKVAILKSRYAAYKKGGAR